MKLNIGGVEILEGGPNSPKLVGFTNVDIRDLPGVDLVIDINRKLPFETGFIEEIRASHVIEHFDLETVKNILSEFWRVLQKYGLLRIYCPNAETLIHDYVLGDINMVKFSTCVFGRQSYKENFHKIAFDRHRLEELLEDVGFIIVGRDPRPNSYRYDLGVQAVKDE